MKFLTSALLLLATIYNAHSVDLGLPNDATNAAISTLLTKFAQDNHVPCFTAGYQIFANKDKGTQLGEKRWTYANPGGLADIENDVKCSVNTVLRVASVSKAIGSGLVASLVEAGKLHWDDDVNKYVPESVFPKKTFNDEKVTITLRQLITHLSGLRTTSTEDLMHDWEFRITNSTQTVAFFAKDPLLSKPGTKFYYSNSGWNLLGAVVEAVEHKSYHLVIREYMHKLGMKHALMDTRLELVPNRGFHYQVKKDSQHGVHHVPAPILDNLRPFPHWPCGGVIATVDDLLTYGSAMLNSYHGHGFLKPETVSAMWNYKPPVDEGTHSVTIDGHKYSSLANRYVLGWDRVDFPVVEKDASLSNLTMVYHTGAIGGSNALLILFPEKNVVVSAIANIGGIGGLLPSLGAQVYHLLANHHK